MVIHLRVLFVLYVGREFFSILACVPIQRSTPSVLTHDNTPAVPSAQARLDEVIRNAYKTMNGDKITLVFPPDDALAPADTSATVTKPVVKRPNVGQTASFACETSMENSSAALIWTHQGRIVVRNGHLLQLLDHQYDISYNGEFAILKIIDVSFASSGEVTCHETANATTTILKRYSLHPNVYRAADVFAVPMLNWSIEKGSTDAFWCKVRLTLPLQMIKSFQLCLWRHNNKTVAAPDTPPYKLGLLTFPKMTMYASQGYMYDASTYVFWMKLVGIDVDDSGSVECWFRATPDVDEWFVQSAALNVRR